MAVAGDEGDGGRVVLWPNWLGLEHQRVEGSSGAVAVGLGRHRVSLAMVIERGATVEGGTGEVTTIIGRGMLGETVGEVVWWF